MDARPGEETLDISGPSSLSHLGPPASSCHCLSRVQTIVGKQGRNRAVHPTSRWVDVGHWDRSERLQKTASHQTASLDPWTKVLFGRLSRIAGQDNATIISPTSDHSGPACIGPGSELPASVAVPCGRKRRGPDRPLSANSPHGRPIKTIASLFDGSPSNLTQGNPRQAVIAASSTPPSSPPLTPLISQPLSTTRSTKPQWNVGDTPITLYTVLRITNVDPSHSRRYHVTEKNPDSLRQQRWQHSLVPAPKDFRGTAADLRVKLKPSTPQACQQPPWH